jgi:hypothetical protein
MAGFLFSRDRRRSRVVRSGFGDGSTVGLERDVVELRAAAHAGVERVQGFELGGVSSKSNTSKFSAIRSGRTDFGIAERPSCRCQRIITSAGVLPWAAAIALMAGSSKVAVPVPR